MTSPLSAAKTLSYASPMTGDDDAMLMLRYARHDDVAAFETLYRRHKDSVYRYLLRHCNHTEAAEDVLQDVWGKIIRSRNSYRPTAKFTTFLYRVAHNSFIDWLRRNGRHSGAAELQEEMVESSDESPDVQTERQLARQRLAAGLQQLPDEQRDAFLLHEEAGLSLEQIASVTGVNRETAKSRLRYAVAKLKTALAEKGSAS
ncbi:MAG: sigma-70 family RNA polymerase sigma factor [Pseudomonadota bacterium]